MRRRTGVAFIIARLPVPVWKRARARRYRNVRGQACCGSCAAPQETYVGWRLHLIGTPHGHPVAGALVPGAEYDLTPMDELTVDVPTGAVGSGDNADYDATGERFLLDDGGVRLVPIRNQPCSRMRGLLHPTYAGLARAARRSIATANVWAERG